MKNNKKTAIIAVIVLVILVAAAAIIYQVTRPETNAGAKNITVEIQHVDGTTRTVEINTDEEYLRGALEQENLISGTESEFGLWITTVDGYTADESNEEWWGYTKGGAYVETGVDTTVIADGDSFELTLNVGYDSF